MRREKAKGPNKYELFGPFYTSTEVAVQEKFYAPARTVRARGSANIPLVPQLHPPERASSPPGPGFVHSFVHRFPPDLWRTGHSSTGARGAGGSGSQNAAAMSTAPEGRNGVPSSR